VVDPAHALLLRAAVDGGLDGSAPPPGLADLIDAGCIALQNGDRYAITERGRRVLGFNRVHRLMARGVAQGIPDGSPPAPALRDLIEAGLVEAYADEHYSLTAAGRALLEIAR